jgi:phosphoribosylamine-glycine ligase
MSAKRFSNKSSALIMPMSHFGGNNIWILKPTGQNRGKGIHVVSSLKTLKKLIKDYVFGREFTIPSGAPTQLSKTWLNQRVASSPP